MTSLEKESSRFIEGLRKRNPNEPQFYTTVEEVVGSILPWYLDQRSLRESQVLERMTEPDRIFSFRVSWQTDDGMPTSTEALRCLQAAGVVVAPGKAANAGGVAVSGMELSQNAMRVSWSRDKVDSALLQIMSDIHERCVVASKPLGKLDYVRGANIAGFQEVANAMHADGAV